MTLENETAMSTFLLSQLMIIRFAEEPYAASMFTDATVNLVLVLFSLPAALDYPRSPFPSVNRVRGDV